jgi:zinc protease
MSRRTQVFLALSALIVAAACSSTTTAPVAQQTTPPPADSQAVQVVQVPVAKEQAPASGPAREIHLPKITRVTTASGLEVNTVPMPGLPVVQVKLVIKAGSAADPADLPGTAQFVAEMLREGTTKKSSAKIAETVDFLGAKLDIGNDEEHVVINMSALSDQLKDAMSLVAELATLPSFDDKELAKLKKRELDRLSLMSQSPNFLARREFYKALYGEHPYAHTDTNKDVVKKIRKSDLVKWHRKYFAPNNAYLVVVGNATTDDVLAAANKAFRDWSPRKVAPLEYPAPPARNATEIVLVDRPESVQSVIYVGNLALKRTDADYIPLTVANQVLGGSAASRLFMDLREKQSLTYGAYSDVDEALQPAPFRAFAAVRNEVTPQAMKGFMNHLLRIRTETTPDAELADAKRFLVDSFPLHIETPAEIAGLVSQLRTYGFPDDYWDGYRSQIQAVTAAQALEAAQKYIRPQAALVVVVGKAAAIKDTLAGYGPVKVIDTEGKVIVDAPTATAATPPAAAPAAAPAPAAAAPAPAAAKPAAANANKEK